MGNTVFENFILADNKHAGFRAHLSNRTQEAVIFRDSAVIAQTTANGEDA